MHRDKIYEYAVIRLVPKVEREEFFNIGLVLFSKREKYIRAQFAVCPRKFESMKTAIDVEDVVANLENFRQVAEGNKKGGPIAELDIPERFRWLTARRSSIIQTSRPHPGKTNNLDETFEKLYRELVL